MADISGKDEKNVEKASSFKLFRSPARNLSRKKSNPLVRMFGSRKKPEDVPNVADAESDTSYNSDDDSGKRRNSDAGVPPFQKIAEETIPEVVHQVLPYANIETSVQQMISAKNPDAESKEFIPADEKKPEFLGDLLEKAEKTKDELLERGNESIQEMFKAVSHTNKAPAEQSTVDDKITSQERSVDTIVDQVKGASIAERLRDEFVAVVGVMQERKEPKEETSQEQKEETSQEPKEVSSRGEDQEEVREEENCVASLAQGLQKMCSTWNTKKED